MIRPAIYAYKFFWQAMDWIYPPACAGCGAAGEVWCADCRNSVVRIRPPVCERCGYPQNSKSSECAGCGKHQPAYTRLRSYGAYQGALKEAIHALKYQSNLALGFVFSQSLSEVIRDEGWKIDVISPIPLSPKRQKERGYNQAASVAHPLAGLLDIEYDAKSLTRIKNTESQVHLTADDRMKNMSGAFMLKERAWTGKRVLIIDDVITTGSTLNECARIAREGGAADVYGVSIARAILNDISA